MSGSRRRGRWLVVLGLALAIVLGAAYALLRIQFDGPDLGSNLASILNKRMRGRIEIGSVEWPASGLKTAARGGWIPITLRDVSVWDDCALSSATADPEELRVGDPNVDCTPDDHPDSDPASRRRPRKLLIRSPEITAEIDAHAVMFGNHDLVFRHVSVHGGEVLIEQTREPYPLHAYDRTVVSIISAFYPRMRAAFRAGIYADSPPPIFDLRDIRVDGVNLTVHAGPYDGSKPDQVGYSFTARIEGVDVDAGVGADITAPGPIPPPAGSYLYMDATDPVVGKFYVRLAAKAQRAHVRLLDSGPRSAFRIIAPGEIYPPPGRNAYDVLELVDVDLHRLAQLPTEWSHGDVVANTLELDLDAHGVPCNSDSSGPAPGTPAPGDLATVHLSGEVRNYWDRPYDGAWNLVLQLENLGPTLHTCVKSKISGDHLNGVVTLTGPFVAAPKVGLELHDLDIAIPLTSDQPPLQLTLAEVHGSIDLVNDTGKIDKTKALVRGGKEPGEIDIAATFALSPYSANASIDIAKPIDAYRFLPARLRDTGSRFVSGHLHATGDVDYGFALDDLDLALGAFPGDRSLRVHGGRLFTKDDFDRIDIDKVRVDAGRTHALVDGWVDTVKSTLHVAIDGEAPDLGLWLQRFGLPALAASAGGGHIVIDGKLNDPTIDVGTELSGVPCLDKLRLQARIAGDIAEVSSFSSGAFGGSLTGSARLRLGGGAPVIEKLHVSGKQLAAARVCGLAGIAKGTLDVVDLDLHGTLDKTRAPMDWLPLASAYVRADHLQVYGDGYTGALACVNRPGDARCKTPARQSATDVRACDAARKGGGFCAVASAVRDDGGTLEATIARAGAHATSALAGTVAIDDLPMAALEPLLGTRTAGGVFSTELHLGGTQLVPQVSGAVYVLRAWIRDAFIGDAQLAVEPAKTSDGHAAIAISGQALAGRLAVHATIGAAAPYPFEATVDVHRVEVTPFFDVQSELHLPDPVEAWATGKVTVKTELAPLGGKPAAPEAWIELAEMRAQVAHRTHDGRLTPLSVTLVPQQDRARASASIHLTPTSIELACRDAAHGSAPCETRLSTPAGDLSLTGAATGAGLALVAEGDVDLGRLQTLLDTTFDELSGGGHLRVLVGGSMRAPTLEAGFELANVRVRPVGSDTVVQAPRGLIKYAGGSLGFNDVTITTPDEGGTAGRGSAPAGERGGIDEGGTAGRGSAPAGERGGIDEGDVVGALHVHGAVKLDGVTPVSWGVFVDGSVAGKLLTVIAPSVFSQGTGIAQLDSSEPITLTGKGALPRIGGRIVLGGAHPIAVTPRGVPHELALTSGAVEISTQTDGDHRTYDLEIGDVFGTIDGVGHIDRINGELILRDGELARASIGLDAYGVPYKIAGTLDLLLAARDISIERADAHAPWVVGGAVIVQSGAFTRNFELTDVIRPSAPTTGRARPFWETYPSLGGALLNNIDLSIEKFEVKNNIAPSIVLAGRATITGTPRDPRLSGQISTQQGRFRLPATRADFTRTTGSVTFSEDRPASNPRLDVTSESDYRDLTGQDHIITLTITGTLEQPQWDLKTSTGYDKSQTMALLLLGRNPEQLRRSLGDQAIGTDPSRVDPTTNPSSTFADQIVKDLAGDWVSGLLGSSLTKFTGLDVLRFELGFGSIGVHAEKKASENITLLFDGEQTIRGHTINPRAVARLPWKILPNDRLQLEGGYLSKDFIDPAELDIHDASGKLVYKLFIP